jgi:hypothetical protein
MHLQRHDQAPFVAQSRCGRESGIVIEDMQINDRPNTELLCMPHFDSAMARVSAWWERGIIDRPPVRFMAPHYFPAITDKPYPSGNQRDKWFDAEFRVEAYLESVEGKVFRAETFPFFYPFLGVDFYAGLYGSELVFEGTSSWAQPALHNWDAVDDLRFEPDNNAYYQKAEQLTRYALERCAGKTLVGYTSLHPGVDAAAALRGYSQFCIDLIENPDAVKKLIGVMLADFPRVFECFNAMLRDNNQPFINWLGVPTYETMHIAGCDFATLISPRFFQEFCLPALTHEAQVAERCVFHLDGEGVARHIDMIMEIPGIDAIQWAQGSGAHRSILQWIPLIRKIQARYPVVVEMDASELEAFMAAMKPEGLYLWIATDDPDQEEAILRRIKRWI